MNEVLESSPPPDGVDVIWKPPDPAPIALCDRDQTKQTLLNLLSNAYDALPASGGSVALEVAGHNGRVTMTVADDGSGMSAETRSQLFEPFFTTKSRGIGLGLAVTRRLVSANQGTLDVQSSLGTGTTVTVSLPRADPSG